MSPAVPRSFYIETLGCQMNVYDSELLRRRLQSAGYRPVTVAKEAAVVLVNACGVRQKAESRAWDRVAQHVKVKGKDGLPLVILCGCVASRRAKGIGGRGKARPDVIAGCGSYDRLLPVVEAELNGGETSKRPVVVTDSPAACYTMPSVAEPSPLKAFVSISRGCDSQCAYCVVPSARGPHRSRPLRDIMEEVTQRGAHGTREVTLLGQNVNVYRDNGAGFADVLRAVDRVPEIWRIRFTSPHPKDMTPSVLELIGRAEKVCENLHLPLQAGSDAILQAMNRGYTTAQYRRLVEIARAEIPNVSISTDLMVGFPGETDAHFEESLQFISEIGFDAAFTFKYSQRPGTPALKFPNQVPEEVKSERMSRLLEVQNRITDALNQRLVGRRVEVLVDGPDQKNPKRLSGRTRTNKLVSFEGNPNLIGTLATVQIESARRWTALGRQVTNGKTGGG